MESDGFSKPPQPLPPPQLPLTLSLFYYVPWTAARCFLQQQPSKTLQKERAASCRWGGSSDVAGRGRWPGCRLGGGVSLQPGPGSQPTGHRGQRPSPDIGPGPGRGPSAGHGLGKSRALRPGSGQRLTQGRSQLHVSMAHGDLPAQQPLPGRASGPAAPGPAHLNTGAQAHGAGGGAWQESQRLSQMEAEAEKHGSSSLDGSSVGA